MTEQDKYEIALYEYVQELRKLRLRCVAKYGIRANDWFGIK
jgi:hypothetical protein